MERSVPVLRPRDSGLLWWCIAGSVSAHLLMLQVLPLWTTAHNSPPMPLSVELREPPAQEIEPPKPLPIETRPIAQEHPKPSPQKPASPAREEKPVEPPRAAPILTASPEAPPSSAATVVTEQRPTPPPDWRPPPASVTAPAPVTPPRTDAAYLNNPRPSYPLVARRRGDQGTVLVRVVVTADGLASSVVLDRSSGHPALDDAALNAVKSWRFVPARQGGQAIESPYVVPVVFKLE